MSIRATAEGMMLGVLCALVVAVGLAAVAYHTEMPGGMLTAGIWVGDALVSLAAGFGAGRRAESGAILHGSLAAVSLCVVGSLVAEAGHWPVGPLWGRLSLAAVMGLTGGIAAVLF